MIYGFNTAAPGKGAVCHVQTEDRGQANSVIDFIVEVEG